MFVEPDEKIGNITSGEELNNAINGIYGLFNDAFNYYQYLATNVKADDINIFSFENYKQKEDTCSFIGFDYIFWNNSNINKNVYSNLYKTIQSANNLIAQADNIQGIAQANACLGEAYFIRSVCYFYLTRLFGEVPLITDIDVNYNIKRSSVADIYNEIEGDMMMAIRLLPSSKESARIPYDTPYRTTAKAVLAEIYLTMAGFPLKDTEKYKLAAQYAGEVIDSAVYNNMALEDDFHKLWDINNFNNNEKTLGFNFDDFYNRYPDRFTYYEQSGKLSINPLREIIPEFNFYNAIPYNYRKRASFHMGYYHDAKYTIENKTYEWFTMEELDPVSFCDFMYYVRYRKWLLNSNNEVIGIYLYRYAHTLLNYAEAKARSNDLDASAYEAVNKIRRRANHITINAPSEFDLQPGLTPEQFADSVIWERAMEFCAEPEGRWFDMLRLEMLNEVHTARYGAEPEVPWYNESTEMNYFNDIPQEDIWLNPGLLEPTN